MDSKTIDIMRSTIHKNNGLNRKQAEYLLNEIVRYKWLLAISVFDTFEAPLNTEQFTIDAIQLDIHDEILQDSNFS